MAQHFLLSAGARSLSIVNIMKMSNDDAFNLFKNIRWSDTNGNPVCPCCGSMNPYIIRSRSQFRCRECFHTYSVTSGTLFAYHKLPLQIYLLAIALFTNGAKSISALQLSRDLDVQYKTAYVLAHKLRESLMDHIEDEKLDGIVEMDGLYVNGYVRPENKKEDRIDRRLSQNQNPNKRTIITARQRVDKNCDLEMDGTYKTKIFVVKGEYSSIINKIAVNNISKGSTIHADESNGYDDLHGFYNMFRVNHSIEYKSELGACNNNCESYNARFRRMQHGNMHKLGNLYMHNYASEIAYREDTRRLSNGTIFKDILTRCLTSSTSNEFCGYWQGNKRVIERLVS